MLKNSKLVLEQLIAAEDELQLEGMSNMILKDESPNPVGPRIFRSVLSKASMAKGYSLIVNVEATALHILYLLETVSHILMPICARSQSNSTTPGKHQPS
jgi:hypothetical protein